MGDEIYIYEMIHAKVWRGQYKPCICSEEHWHKYQNFFENILTAIFTSNDIFVKYHHILLSKLRILLDNQKNWKKRQKKLYISFFHVVLFFILYFIIIIKAFTNRHFYMSRVWFLTDWALGKADKDTRNPRECSCQRILSQCHPPKNLLNFLISLSQRANLPTTQISSQLPTQNPDAPNAIDRMMRLLDSYSILSCSLVTLEDGCTERLYGLARGMEMGSLLLLGWL